MEEVVVVPSTRRSTRHRQHCASIQMPAVGNAASVATRYQRCSDCNRSKAISRHKGPMTAGLQKHHVTLSLIALPLTAAKAAPQTP